VLLAQLVLDWKISAPSISLRAEVPYSLEDSFTPTLPKFEFVASIACAGTKDDIFVNHLTWKKNFDSSLNNFFNFLLVCKQEKDENFWILHF